MNLTFRIEYRTTWGECLYVVLNNEIEVELSTTDGHLWQGSCEYLPAEEGRVIAYRYAVYRNGKCIRKEFGAIAHTFFPADIHEHHYIFDDSWRDLPAESYRYSSAFNGIYTPQTPALPTEYDASYITFRALCPGLGIRHQALALTGEGTTLGNWGKDSKPIRMQEVQPNVWQLALKTDNLPQVTDYKFVAIDEQTGNIVDWENGSNHTLYLPHLETRETFMPQETEVYFQDILCRIAGSAIPVFSLRSEGSYGVGDFGDLKTSIQWAADTHQKAVQVLPINDTTMTGHLCLPPHVCGPQATSCPERPGSRTTL